MNIYSYFQQHFKLLINNFQNASPKYSNAKVQAHSGLNAPSSAKALPLSYVSSEGRPALERFRDLNFERRAISSSLPARARPREGAPKSLRSIFKGDPRAAEVMRTEAEWRAGIAGGGTFFSHTCGAIAAAHANFAAGGV